MTDLKTQRSRWLRTFVIVVVVLGVFFRGYNLDRKVFWYDETMTLLRVSGNTNETIVQNAYDADITTVEALLTTYQFPNVDHGWDDTLAALKEHPEHSPLYYLMVRGWLQLFGHSTATIRALSLIFGLLVLPCAYWLGVELFRERRYGWAIATIMAISPFHVLYSQEAREYSLWTLTILLSSATLLWAERRKTIREWGLYGVTIALGLYTHPFSGFVSISHGIYVLASDGFRWTKRLTAYLLASALGMLLFLPWLWIVIQHFSKFVSNTQSVGLEREGVMPLFWALNLSRVFFDLNQGPSAINPLHYILVGLAIYALYYLYQHGPRHAWIFVMTLAGVTGLALLMPDIIWGGRRSSITRYAIPSYIGLQIAIAYLFAHHLTTDLTAPNWKRWRTGAIAFVALGVISMAVSSQIPVWWHKSYAKSRYNPTTAAIVNQSPNPLVVTNELPGSILSFSHLLRPDVHLQLITRSKNIAIPVEEYDPTFLYKSTPRFRRDLESQNLTLTPQYEEDWLWTIDSKS
ncbi:MAG: glycosyltransferase family 39 protein [Synechococcales cyanobacterium T60_A2020_003]|nr:glycosyltransferase family 39 protein [Synechococcales cyanobacterium T60_A2020_003]